MIHRESGTFKTSYIADMAVFPLPIARWTVAALTVMFVLIVPAAFSEYHLSIVNLIMIAVVGALGLNILVGCTGQISVGHGALMSVGAYTAANLITRLNAPFWVALPAGGAMAARSAQSLVFLRSASKVCISRSPRSLASSLSNG